MARKSGLSSRGGHITLIIFGLVFAGFAGMWTLLAWRGGAPFFALLFGLAFMTAGLILIGVGALQFIARSRIGTPNVAISPEMLRVGERFAFTLEHTFKSNVNVQRILVQLLQRESATYRRGTDTYTVTHEEVATEFEIPARPFRRGETLYDNRSLQIPRTAMHTFKARNNKIQWFLRLKIEVPGWPDLNQEYQLLVLPELVKEVV